MLSKPVAESRHNNIADSNSYKENGVLNGDSSDKPTVKGIAPCYVLYKIKA